MGGITLLQLHNDSLLQLLSSLYPDYEWLPWKFHKSPKNFWDDLRNIRKFMDFSGKELGIKEMNDWHNVSNQV